jgi:hypothetical protein
MGSKTPFAARGARTLLAAAVAVTFLAAAPGALARGDPPVRSPGTTRTTTTPAPTSGQAGLAKASQVAAEQSDIPALTAFDPFCSQQMTGAAAANCRESGSVAEQYPISSYGIDYANPPTGMSELSPGAWFSTVMGSVTAVVWDFWLYAIRGLISILNWAFTLRLVQDAMSTVQQGMNIMHTRVFGVSWLEAAMAVIGLWSLWNGLVRRKTVETLAGLAGTVALMVAALVLIQQPSQTIGTLSDYADQASLAALSGVANADVAQPTTTLSDAEGNLFTGLILRPWCALEFGDVSYCLQPRDGTTVADIWLAFDAMGAGRQGLYNLATTGSIEQYGGVLGTFGQFVGVVPQQPPVVTVADACGSGGNQLQCEALKNAQALSCYGGHATPACAFSASQSNDVQMQAGADPLTRLVMLFLITIGLIGAACLIGYIAIHLVFAAIMTLILLLAAPVMLLLPAFGEGGRTTTVAYFKRLGGALITKVIFAIVLALVLWMSWTLQSLGLNWFSEWILSTVFWWGAFTRRKQMIGFLTLDKRTADQGLAVGGDGTPNPMRLMNLYYGMRFLAAGRSIVRGATSLPRALHGRGVERRTADTAALREEYRDEFEGRMQGAAELDRTYRRAGAQDVVAQRDARGQRVSDMRERRRDHRSRLPQIDRELQRPNLQPPYRLALENERNRRRLDLTAIRTDLPLAEADLAAAEPAARDARSILARTVGPVDDRDVQRTIAQRRRDLAQPFPVDDTSEEFGRHLEAAGISREAYATATPADQIAYTEEAQAARDRDQELLRRLDDPRVRAGLPDTRREVRVGWREMAVRGRVARARTRSAEEVRAMRTRRALERTRRGRR